MSRLPISLVLFLAVAGTVACGSAAESEVAAAADEDATPELVMDEVMIQIPADELAMLEEEVAFLRRESARMQEELASQDSAPSAKQVARAVSAQSRMVQASGELRRLRAELEETKSRLAVAEERNVELETDLAETRADLHETQEVLVETSTRLARTEKDLESTRTDLDGALRVAADAGWSDLVSRSQAALCPKGGRKKMERCREDALAGVRPLEPAARACLRAGHATPALRARERGEDMPREAVFIGNGDRDWFVVLCDPTLPEAKALLADLDGAGRAEPMLDAMDELDDLEMEAPKASTKTRGAVARTSREAPVERAAPEPLEPPELREPAPSGTIDLEGYDIIDLDAGTDDEDDKLTRKERRRQKELEEELEEARRERKALDGVGEDLIDE